MIRQSIPSFVLIFFSTLLLAACQVKDSIDKEHVFESIKEGDSLVFYFPEILNDTFERENPYYQNIQQKEFSTSLNSFQEPILYNKTDSQTIYRWLWHRNFNPPICLSIKKVGNRWFLSSKMLDKYPSFHLLLKAKNVGGKEIIETTVKNDRDARLTFRQFTKLTYSQGKKLENLLIKIDFWNSPMRDLSGAEGATDGEPWIIEGRENGRYHFIKRYAREEALVEFGEFLLKLSDISIRKIDLY